MKRAAFGRSWPSNMSTYSARERIGCEEVLAVVDEDGRYADHRIHDLLQRGADAGLGRPPARRRRERLHGARRVEQVRALGVVEAQPTGEGVEHALGGAAEIAALHPVVVIDAD